MYGVEPASYYVKNLFLNTGFAWVFTLLCPFVVGLDVLVTKRKDIDDTFLTIFGATLLWLGVLFSRKHKVRKGMNVTTFLLFSSVFHRKRDFSIPHIL